ncbi:plasmid mobilization relaxosome protein MobC [Arthrobacter sp. I2-34]|uniref:Plasmid mobilization relaxosome protein MobC n=1 Tax=Arthrobacter hankyongi TaxID=2904801 RepID=A0ABS9L239_9MICC|nr:plasmid mobilization relaxosome protein MobC [Arthrobacter hankyongi]MCG2620757.1 plasmid mobilization relaxosome protein MobC [Arthrobacter hankyongi]
MDGNQHPVWRGRRRRANVAGGGRVHRHEVKVSAEEEARLLALAERHQVTVPRLLIEAALSAEGQVPAHRRELIAELARLQQLVGTVSNSINRLAGHAGATGRVPAESAASIAHARGLIIRIDRLLAWLAARPKSGRS